MAEERQGEAHPSHCSALLAVWCSILLAERDTQRRSLVEKSSFCVTCYLRFTLLPSRPPPPSRFSLPANCFFFLFNIPSIFQEMIDEADRDGDGEINEEEFLRIMKKTSLY